MQNHVVLVSAVAVLGIAAVVLGGVASEKSKGPGFVRFESIDEHHYCVYQRKPALGYGVAGALLALTAVALATVAIPDAIIEADAPATDRRLGGAICCFNYAWFTVASAVVAFLYGVAMKRELDTEGWHDRRAYYYGCTEFKSAMFDCASVLSAIATGCAIAAYVKFQRTDEPAPGPFVELGVEMGQPQWAQPYPPPPMANPAPPQYGHGVEMGQPQSAQPYPPPPMANPAPPQATQPTGTA